MSEHSGQLLLSLHSYISSTASKKQISDPQGWDRSTPASTSPQTTQGTSQAIARKAGPAHLGGPPS